MNKLKGFCLFFSILILSLSSCKKENTGTYSDTIVYVVGFEKINGFNVATLWENGEPIRLSDGKSNVEAHSVFVVGDDVYVAGIAVLGLSRTAMLWKNGVPTPLSFLDSRARSVFVLHNDVYVSGEERGNCVFWKNRSVTPLAFSLSYGYGISANKDQVFVAGIIGFDQARLWKDTHEIMLNTSPAANGSIAYAVCVEGDDVYMAGSETTGPRSSAVYWKNNIINVLTDGTTQSSAKSVYVEGSDVYIAGSIGVAGGGAQHAVYWRNNKEVHLSDGKHPAEARSVYCVNGEVYVAGFERINKQDYVAVLWKNGERILLGNTELGDWSEAFSVFVRR